MYRCMTFIVALAVAAAPSVASAMEVSGEIGHHQSGASAMAYLRLPFGGTRDQPRGPQLGVRVAALQSYRDARAPTGPVYQADALDLRLTAHARPTLLVAGQRLSTSPRRLNALGTAGTIALVGGGVLLLVLVAAAVGGAGFGNTCPTVGGSRDHCINP